VELQIKKTAKLLTKDEARRISVNISKLPEIIPPAVNREAEEGRLLHDRNLESHL
jgi:hypothetical protein